jgi:CRISPR/Cas system-associated exonuclease Cas4 (RecB family)
MAERIMARTEVSLPTLRGEQCGGGAPRRRRHKKPFIGISDLGQLTFCEIQSTISQIAKQPAYIESAFADDRTGGVNVSSRPEVTPDEKRDVARRIEILSAAGPSDALLRRTAGHLAESVELSGVTSERRHFDFGPFYIIGRPDGVTAISVIEFALSRSPHLAVHGKRVQGNLYAVLWEKQGARIVLLGSESGARLEQELQANAIEAERWIQRAWQLLSGAAPPAAPERATKCRSCVYNKRRGCPFPRDGTIPTIDEMTIIAGRFGS